MFFRLLLGFRFDVAGKAGFRDLLHTQNPILVLRLLPHPVWGFLFLPMRKTITNTLRFEVFKRDKFTCQYCGSQAPTVILNVDHIHPVSKGGKNDMLNLITSCKECNSGKRDKVISDESMLNKQKKQMDEIQERHNQLELMAKWQREMLDIEIGFVDIADKLMDTLYGFNLTQIGRSQILKSINRFGIGEVCEALRIAHGNYFDGSKESAIYALSKVGGICYNRKNKRDQENG